METSDAIYQRRAIKHFDPTFVLPEADQKKIFELAQQSPSSFNIQHWRLVQVTDTAKRALIQQAAWGQEQVTQASMLLVVCADLMAWNEQPERYWMNAPQAVRDTLVPMIGRFYADNPTLQRDEAMRSIGIISQTIMLAAKTLGYDSCPMVGFDQQKVADIIRLPQHYTMGILIAIGKATEPARPKGGYLPLSDILFENHF